MNDFSMLNFSITVFSSSELNATVYNTAMYNLKNKTCFIKTSKLSCEVLGK